MLTPTEFTLAAAAATLGGTVGAVGTALLSWSQLAASTRDLQRAIESKDPSKLEQAASKLLQDIGGFAAALARLRSALRIR